MSEDLLYEEIYQKTQDCGRAQFVKLLQQNQIKIEKLQQENKELKEKYSKLEDKYIKNLPCCNEEDCSLYNHAINTDYVLTEFEKWLETTLENEKFCYLSPHGEDRYRYDIFKKCLDKLQELKEGNNGKI